MYKFHFLDAGGCGNQETAMIDNIYACNESIGGFLQPNISASATTRWDKIIRVGVSLLTWGEGCEFNETRGQTR